jgi:hypothetical protein
VPARILDLAEALAEKAGVETVQDYCALLLMRALENERVQQKVAEFETRRGPLEGLKQIADDPEYLAEWQERRDSGQAEIPPVDSKTDDRSEANTVVSGVPVPVDVRFVQEEPKSANSPDERVAAEPRIEPASPAAPQVRIEASAGFVPSVSMNPTVRLMSEPSPSKIITRHVAAREDELGFLPCLRRGQRVPAAKVAELIGALRRLEEDLRGVEVIDRTVAYALHRLALESQVMLTDAWPGAFDENTIGTIRTVQEAVERVLSGQDIRYYPTVAAPHPERPS